MDNRCSILQDPVSLLSRDERSSTDLTGGAVWSGLALVADIWKGAWRYIQGS